MSINERENAEKEGLVSGVSDHADIAAQDKVFLVDYCKRGITKCKGCGKNIPKDELRIGKSVKFKDKYIYQYLHPQCAFDSFKKVRLAANANLHG